MKDKRKQRSRAYYRHHRERVIQRKRKIMQHNLWYEEIPGKLAKGKIHCSCYYCREKTSEMGWPKSELVKLERGGLEDHDL